jgi:hypothetical protein
MKTIGRKLLRSSLLLAALLAPGAAQGTDVTLADLSQGLLDAEAALKTVSVTCDYKFQMWSPWQPELGPTTSVQHGVCTLEASGRCRFEGGGEMRSPGLPPRRVRAIAVFDGKRMKVLEGDDNRYFRGRVSELPQIPWLLDPHEYLYHYNHKSLGKTLVEEECQIGGTAMWDGRRVLAVESKVRVDSEGARYKYRFLIDCERGFAVVRRSMAIYRPAEKGWFDYAWIDGHNYSEVSPGTWLPSEVKTEAYAASPQKSILMHRQEVRNSNWVLNAPLSDAQFELEFPPVIMVLDEQTGKTYQTVKIKNDKIVAQVAEGLEIYQEKKGWSVWMLFLFWTSVALLGVGSLLAAGVFLRRKRAVTPAVPSQGG